MMTSTPAASFRKSACPSGAFMLRAMERLFRFTYEKAARRWVSPSSSAGVSILRTSAPMSASIMPGISAGGTRASSSTLIPSRTPMPFLLAGRLAVRVRRLDGRCPEHGIVAGEDAPAQEARDRLQPLDRVHGPRRIPHDAGRDFLV